MHAAIRVPMGSLSSSFIPAEGLEQTPLSPRASSCRIGPQPSRVRFAASRTLDGEDRFGMIDGEGKGGERSRGHGTTTDHEG